MNNIEPIKVDDRLIEIGKNFYGTRIQPALFYSSMIMTIANVTREPHKPLIIVEIGSYHGFATCCFALALKEIYESTNHSKKGMVWTFDTHPDNTAVTKANAEMLGVSEFVTAVTGDGAGMITANEQLRDIDFLFIDGSHRRADVYNDIIATFNFVRRNGYILCDDYGQEQCRQGQDKAYYQKELEGRAMERIYLPTVGGGMLIRKLTNGG